jgi:hypothetical protein
LTALGAWLASPYRALGIYIGGVNRACPDGNLSAAWVASAEEGGWSLLPLYVGLQAPCVQQQDLARVNPSSAAAQGTAAADDAVRRAATFGLAPPDPIYFDMEGYATNQPTCSRTVQTFLQAWVGELHAQGYTAGVYGSAASTIRDLASLVSAGSSTVPDDIWIGDWNGKQSVFGDPYVPDSAWPDHQRVHQYSGGHDESYGGITINVDDDVVDAAVARQVTTAIPGGTSSPGSVTSSDGQVTASWPAASFSESAQVTLTAGALSPATQGFAAGSYLVQLQALTSASQTPVSQFGSPLSLRFTAPGAGVVPAFSSDGQAWTVMLRLPAGKLPAGASVGYAQGADGSITVRTRVPGWFGMLLDVTPPVLSGAPTGRLSGTRIRLWWTPATDNSGAVASYQVLLDGNSVQTAPGTAASAALSRPLPLTRSVLRIVARDGAGNVSKPSSSLLVVPRSRPAGVPVAIPRWAWRLLSWQRAGRSGPRPQTPVPLPRWYWRWAGWQLQPLRIES